MDAYFNDIKNWKKTGIKGYTTFFCKPPIGITVRNNFLGMSWVTDEQNQFVLCDSQGDMRPISLMQLSKNFTSPGGKAITPVEIKSFMKDREDGLIDWVKITAKSQPLDKLAIKLPPEMYMNYPILLGGAQVIANNAGRGDLYGGDWVVCNESKGQPDLNTARLVSGFVFASEYNIRGVSPSQELRMIADMEVLAPQSIIGKGRAATRRGTPVVQFQAGSTKNIGGEAVDVSRPQRLADNPLEGIFKLRSAKILRNLGMADAEILRNVQGDENGKGSKVYIKGKVFGLNVALQELGNDTYLIASIKADMASERRARLAINVGGTESGMIAGWNPLISWNVEAVGSDDNSALGAAMDRLGNMSSMLLEAKADGEGLTLQGLLNWMMLQDYRKVTGIHSTFDYEDKIMADGECIGIVNLGCEFVDGTTIPKNSRVEVYEQEVNGKTFRHCIMQLTYNGGNKLDLRVEGYDDYKWDSKHCAVKTLKGISFKAVASNDVVKALEDVLIKKYKYRCEYYTEMPQGKVFGINHLEEGEVKEIPEAELQKRVANILAGVQRENHWYTYGIENIMPDNTGVYVNYSKVPIMAGPANETVPPEDMFDESWYNDDGGDDGEDGTAGAPVDGGNQPQDGSGAANIPPEDMFDESWYDNGSEEEFKEALYAMMKRTLKELGHDEDDDVPEDDEETEFRYPLTRIYDENYNEYPTSIIIVLDPAEKQGYIGVDVWDTGFFKLSPVVTLDDWGTDDRKTQLKLADTLYLWARKHKNLLEPLYDDEEEAFKALVKLIMIDLARETAVHMGVKVDDKTPIRTKGDGTHGRVQMVVRQLPGNKRLIVDVVYSYEPLASLEPRIKVIDANGNDVETVKDYLQPIRLNVGLPGVLAGFKAIRETGNMADEAKDYYDDTDLHTMQLMEKSVLNKDMAVRLFQEMLRGLNLTAEVTANMVQTVPGKDRFIIYPTGRTDAGREMGVGIEFWQEGNGYMAGAGIYLKDSGHFGKQYHLDRVSREIPVNALEPSEIDTVVETFLNEIPDQTQALQKEFAYVQSGALPWDVLDKAVLSLGAEMATELASGKIFKRWNSTNTRTHSNEFTEWQTWQYNLYEPETRPNAGDTSIVIEVDQIKDGVFEASASLVEPDGSGLKTLLPEIKTSSDVDGVYALKELLYMVDKNSEPYRQLIQGMSYPKNGGNTQGNSRKPSSSMKPVADAAVQIFKEMRTALAPDFMTYEIPDDACKIAKSPDGGMQIILSTDKTNSVKDMGFGIALIPNDGKYWAEIGVYVEDEGLSGTKYHVSRTAPGLRIDSLTKDEIMRALEVFSNNGGGQPEDIKREYRYIKEGGLPWDSINKRMKKTGGDIVGFLTGRKGIKDEYLFFGGEDNGDFGDYKDWFYKLGVTKDGKDLGIIIEISDARNGGNGNGNAQSFYASYMMVTNEPSGVDYFGEEEVAQSKTDAADALQKLLEKAKKNAGTYIQTMNELLA